MTAKTGYRLESPPKELGMQRPFVRFTNLGKKTGDAMRRTILSIVFVLLGLASSQAAVTGDFSGDDLVDLKDIILCLQVSSSVVPAQAVTVSGDVDGNGKMGLSDAVFILQTIAGFRTDTDNDGFYDNTDNCPRHCNPDQTDGDASGKGDVCEPLNPTDFRVTMERIHYRDDSGREIDYDFSTGYLGASGELKIPSNALLATPPSETGSDYYWERFPINQVGVLEEGAYRLSIPQATSQLPTIPKATITVDGSEADWNGVAVYIEDPSNDVPYWMAPSTGTDLQYLKLAYSPKNAKLYILMKLTSSVNQGMWYRLFIDKDLDGDIGEPGDFQIDIQFVGSSWQVVSQGWNSPSGDDWYPVAEGGVVAVSGNIIEVRVDTSAFGLTDPFIAFGRTMAGSFPYNDYDTFQTNYYETEGWTALGGNCQEAASTEWEFSSRLSDFQNAGQAQHYYAVSVGAGSWEDDDLEAYVYATWFTGTYNGDSYTNALILEAEVLNDLEGDQAYEWWWGLDTGEGVLLDGLDPATTVLDLKIAITDNGQTVSAYYRLNSEEHQPWTLLVTHALPDGVGRVYGYCEVYPTVSMETGVVE